MPISKEQQQDLRAAHALGFLDSQIADHAGVSLTTVKRYRKKFDLETNCETAQRGRQGEQFVADRASAIGLKVTWRPRDGAEYDLLIADWRVDVKSSMRLEEGLWRFRLPENRKSFYGRYTYKKRVAEDCDMLGLVCLYPDVREPDVYFVGSQYAPKEIRIRPGGEYEDFKNAWDVFQPVGKPLLA